MAIRYKYFNTDKLSDEFTCRFDANFILFEKKEDNDYYKLSDLCAFVSDDTVDYNELSDFQYVEIGNITKYQEVFPVSLNIDERNELNENYFNKIEKGDIIKVEEGDILIAKVRPYLKKVLFITPDIKNYYYTAAFIHLRPKYSNKIIFYCLRYIFIDYLNSIARQGKGYPTLNENDLSTLRLNKKKIDILLTNENYLLKTINPVEQNIYKNKLKKKDALDIINSIIAKEFNLNIAKLMSLDKTQHLKVLLTDINNDMGLRCSARYHKMQFIENIILSNFDNDILDNYLLEPKTKNGWSPDNNELEGENKLLGIDSLNTDGILSFSNPKYTNEKRNDISNFYVQEGDFFISRGNTVDLVALSSIASDVEDDYIYPDIMIKLYLDEKKIDKTYLSYVFNSIIGRLYFKYSSKGKQQSMVKVSSDIIRHFPIPKISIKEQRKIAKMIKAKLSKQREIADIIHKYQLQIESILSDYIIQRSIS